MNSHSSKTQQVSQPAGQTDSQTEYSLKQKLQYRFDNFMSQGTVAVIGVLFVLTILLVVLLGILAAVFDRETGIFRSIWGSLNRTLFPDPLAGDEGSPVFVFMMFLATLIGLLFTSVLIGVINTGIQDKIEDLRRGHSLVIERSHTLILGFDETTYTIIGQLVLANENQRNAAIVVLGPGEKTEMEEAIRRHVPDWKTTRIICRSGETDSIADLEMCAIYTARAVIVNTLDDATIVQTVLAASTVLEKYGNDTAHIVCMIKNEAIRDAVLIAGKGRAEVLCCSDFLARITANACRQPGISAVFTELLDFEGDEIYVEHIKGAVGKTIAQLNLMFPCSTVMGVSRNRDARQAPAEDYDNNLPKSQRNSSGVALLGSARDYAVGPDDELILLARDDGVSVPDDNPHDVDFGTFAEVGAGEPAPIHMLVLGYNGNLHKVLAQLDEYLAVGSRVTVAVPVAMQCEKLEGRTYRNFPVEILRCDVLDAGVMEQLLEQKPDNILVPMPGEMHGNKADSHTLSILLLIRHHSLRMGHRFPVTSELYLPQSVELAQVTKATDFIVSSNLLALFLAQASQQRALVPIFEDLLDEAGAEIYLKPASGYVKMGAPMNLYTASAAVARKSEVFIGYRRTLDDAGNFDIRMNLPKDTVEVFGPEDMFIVLAKDGG